MEINAQFWKKVKLIHKLSVRMNIVKGSQNAQLCQTETLSLKSFKIQERSKSSTVL
jgi:hypothetical protein